MQILLLIALLTVGGLINFIKKPKAKLVHRLVQAYVIIVIIISISSWIFHCAATKNSLLWKILSIQLNWFNSIANLLLGYLMAGIFRSYMSADADECHAKKITGLTLRGLTILTGFSFLTESYWKAGHFGKMIIFFNASGYAIWFLYFIMIAEALGGLGVLLHYKLKTGIMATAGLMLIMIGALYTHCHNKDPFSDSYAAIAQFITLSLMQVIYYFEKHANAASQHFVTVT
jgi:hypothetical protein